MRASKKSKKSTDTTLTPDEWKGAVDASVAQDEETVLEGTGVEHDGAGPVVMVKLTEEQRAAAGEHLAQMLHDLAELEQEARDDASARRKDLKARRLRIAELREEVLSGVRKESAQPPLPGVDA